MVVRMDEKGVPFWAVNNRELTVGLLKKTGRRSEVGGMVSCRLRVSFEFFDRTSHFGYQKPSA